VEPADADDRRDRPQGGDAGAGARARPHACEDLWWRSALQTSLSSWNCSIPCNSRYVVLGHSLYPYVHVYHGTCPCTMSKKFAQQSPAAPPATASSAAAAGAGEAARRRPQRDCSPRAALPLPVVLGSYAASTWPARSSCSTLRTSQSFLGDQGGEHSRKLEGLVLKHAGE
jgi:hypothetical protein